MISMQKLAEVYVKTLQRQVTSDQLARAMKNYEKIALEVVNDSELLKLHYDDYLCRDRNIPMANMAIEASFEAAKRLIMDKPELLDQCSESGYSGWHVAAARHPELLLSSLLAMPDKDARSILTKSARNGNRVIDELALNCTSIDDARLLVGGFYKIMLENKQAMHAVMNNMTRLAHDKVRKIYESNAELTLDQFDEMMAAFRTISDIADRKPLKGVLR